MVSLADTIWGFCSPKIVTDKTFDICNLLNPLVFVVSKIVTDKTLMKKLSENQRAPVLLDKPFIDQATRRRLYKILVKQKNLPEGRISGLFYLTVLGTVTEDYTWVYRGKVTTQCKWKIKQISDEVLESWLTHGNG